MKILKSFLFIFLVVLSGCKKDKQYYNNLYLIDVNSKEIFDDAKIEGAINVQLEDVDNLAKNLNKDFKLIFYCTDYFCSESSRVAKAFYDLGFKNLFIYAGGIQEWYQLYLKDNKDYRFEGKAEFKFLKANIEKIDKKSDFKIISAQELSALLKTSKAA